MQGAPETFVLCRSGSAMSVLGLCVDIVVRDSELLFSYDQLHPVLLGLLYCLYLVVMQRYSLETLAALHQLYTQGVHFHI